MGNMLTGMLLKRIHDCLEKKANNALRSKGLTWMQMSVLLDLQEAPEKKLSMKEIERHFQVAQSTVVGIVARLEQKGLVEAFGDASDRRIKLVHITLAGEACCRETVHDREETEKMILQGFSGEEQKILNSLLARVADNVR